ncbi:MAG: galactokinase [Clostridia bacterium]|nr:galactokinase [Clostridia bacterium]
MQIDAVIQNIEKDAFLPLFRQLYSDEERELTRQKNRYGKAIDSFRKIYPKREEIQIFSASGRTEIGGNHTDHQHGCVLAAAVHLDSIGVVSFHNDGVIRVKSEGYDAFSVSLSDLNVHSGEPGSAAIVRGVVAGFQKKGILVEGFDLYCTSDVLSGSGISSSAAFETLLGTMIDGFYGKGQVGAVEIAKIGQFAENVYFGKQSGLMDQMVSSVGGLVSIDFRDTENPKIENFQFDFEKAGYCICLTDTKGSHADLTADYVAIRTEMESVANEFGASFLRDVSETEFYKNLPKLREACSDRALVRSAHFFDENKRAVLEAEALKQNDFDTFLKLVRQSGASSETLLQNLYTCKNPISQEIPLALMLSRRLLGSSGAARVHGGGFAGTIQAFVPLEKRSAYIAEMNRIFGDGSCIELRIRPVGGMEITI